MTRETTQQQIFCDAVYSVNGIVLFPTVLRCLIISNVELCKGDSVKSNVLLSQEKKEPTDDTSKDVYSLQINSTCFGHHYAHRQENRLYRTECGVSLDVLAAVVWRQDTS